MNSEPSLGNRESAQNAIAIKLNTAAVRQCPSAIASSSTPAAAAKMTITPIRRPLARATESNPTSTASSQNVQPSFFTEQITATSASDKHVPQTQGLWMNPVPVSTIAARRPPDNPRPINRERQDRLVNADEIANDQIPLFTAQPPAHQQRYRLPASA